MQQLNITNEDPTAKFFSNPFPKYQSDLSKLVKIEHKRSGGSEKDAIIMVLVHYSTNEFYDYQQREEGKIPMNIVEKLLRQIFVSAKNEFPNHINMDSGMTIAPIIYEHALSNEGVHISINYMKIAKQLIALENL